MHRLLVCCLFFINALTCYCQWATECVMQCNDLRYEVLTLAICREAKKTLPRPKVGDFCTLAMEKGFEDACVSLCNGEKPVAKVAQSCRAAAIEMPRPTVRKWCEHGYRTAFDKAVKELTPHFKGKREVQQNQPEDTVQTSSTVTLSTQVPSEKTKELIIEEEKIIPKESKLLVASVPISLDDTEFIIEIFEGDNPEDVVVNFCRNHLPDDVSGCIRQILPSVLEKI